MPTTLNCVYATTDISRITSMLLSVQHIKKTSKLKRDSVKTARVGIGSTLRDLADCTPMMYFCLGDV